MKNFLLSLTLAGLLVMPINVIAQGWRGIVPLHSTRQEVERVLGSPKESNGSFSSYETKTEEIRMFYSIASCEADKSADWNVPVGIVIQFTIHPKQKLLLTDLKLDHAKFERKLDYHVQGIVYYFNRTEGVMVDTRILEGNVEDVFGITYWARTADQHLRCPKSAHPKHASNKSLDASGGSVFLN